MKNEISRPPCRLSHKELRVCVRYPSKQMTSDLDCVTEIIWHRFILFSYGVIYLFSVPTLAIYYILFQSLTLSLPWHELHKHTRDLWAATSFIICLVYRSSIQKASYNRVEPSFYNSLELLRCEIDDDMSSKASSSLAHRGLVALRKGESG